MPWMSRRQAFSQFFRGRQIPGARRITRTQRRPAPAPLDTTLRYKVHTCQETIAELERMKRALQTLVHSCRDGAALDCPIIEALDNQKARHGRRDSGNRNTRSH